MIANQSIRACRTIPSLGLPCGGSLNELAQFKRHLLTSSFRLLTAFWILKTIGNTVAPPIVYAMGSWMKRTGSCNRKKMKRPVTRGALMPQKMVTDMANHDSITNTTTLSIRYSPLTPCFTANMMRFSSSARDSKNTDL